MSDSMETQRAVYRAVMGPRLAEARKAINAEIVSLYNERGIDFVAANVEELFVEIAFLTTLVQSYEMALNAVREAGSVEGAAAILDGKPAPKAETFRSKPQGVETFGLYL